MLFSTGMGSRYLCIIFTRANRGKLDMKGDTLEWVSSFFMGLICHVMFTVYSKIFR